MGHLFLPDDRRKFISLNNLTASEKVYLTQSEKKNEILGMIFLISDFGVLDLLIDETNINSIVRIWDVNYKHYSQYLLTTAVYYDRCDLVDYLLSHNCNVHNEKNLLKIACSKSSDAIISKLLMAGCLPTLSDCSFAIRYNRKNIIGLFVFYGVDLNSEDDTFLNLPLVAALDYTNKTKDTELIDFLFSNGLNVSRSSMPYIFHIIHTYSDNDINIIQSILSHGINVNIIDEVNGHSSYYQAKIQNKPLIADLILSYEEI